MARLLPFQLARLHRRGPPWFRPNDRAIATLLPNCSDASDGKLDSRLACAYARAGSTNRMYGQTRQYGKAAGGGRGFISLERGCPITAPTLMRRFFLGPEVLNFFPEFKHSNALGSDLCKQKQCSPSARAMASGHLFSRRGQADQPSEKLSRNSRGGEGCTVTDFLERTK
jgi:hypothetical protein